MTPNQISIKKLKQEISAARNDLQHTWAIHGCTTPTVLAAAERLDTLFNQYSRLTDRQCPNETLEEA